MSRLDYRALRARISILQVLDLIHYVPAERRADQWRGPCPLCHSHRPDKPKQQQSRRDRHRCFSVNVAKNVFRCFSCHRSGNSLDFWINLTGLPLYEATQDLCDQLKLANFTANQQRQDSG